MSTYFLAAHVHVCQVGGSVVFLDLRRDHYFAIDLASARALAPYIDRWSINEAPLDERVASSQPDPGSGTDVHDACRSLLESGLFTTDARTGRPATPPSVEPVAEVLVPDEGLSSPQPTTREVVAFLCAYGRAYLEWRTQSFERIVANFRARKERACRAGVVSEVNRDRHLVAIFDRLRPLIFTQKDQCLLDSTALLHFLARHGSYPTWVIGVMTVPFGAHSWVQAHGRLFNGPIEYWGRYTPILTV